ncbi:MAG: hypothetical protein E7196_03070 [Anaerovibrio lipolyticus]|nr:hypothetical protein [Anaerovibrio lipolyticus]
MKGCLVMENNNAKTVATIGAGSALSAAGVASISSLAGLVGGGALATVAAPILVSGAVLGGLFSLFSDD